MTPQEFNQRCVEQLNALELRHRIAVVGSGPSQPYIAPIAELRTKLANRCDVEDLPNEPFWDFCERAFTANAEQYWRVLRETYDKTPYWSSHVYRHLVAIGFQGMATFNYDEQLPMEFAARFGNTGKFSVYPSRGDQRYCLPAEFASAPPKLICLHGYCGSDDPIWERDIILKRSDYNTHYIHHPAPLFAWWLELLLSAPCIFIGTSLREPGLYRVLEEIIPQYEDRLLAQSHVHLIAAKPNSVTQQYPAAETTLGVIRQIQYDPVDIRYSGLLAVLSRFSQINLSRPRPNVAAPRAITATDDMNFSAL